MENQVNTVRSNKTLVFLTVMTLLSGLLTAILFQTGILLISLTAGFLASVFLIESCRKRRLTYILPIILILLDLIFNGVFSLNALASVFAAAVIYLCFIKWRAKSECSVYLTILITVFIVISFILVGFFVTKSFSISKVTDYYVEQTELIRSEFVRVFSSLAMENAEGQVEYLFTEGDLNYLFDSFFKSLISCFAVLAFAICGFALKIFTSFGVKKSPFSDRLPSYSFSTTNLFAYFYILLVVVNIFMSEPSGLFAISIINLNNVFTFVYAYLGYKYLSEMLSRQTGKRLLSKILILVVALIFYSFALQLLAYMGAFMTIVRNRAEKITGSGKDIND